MNRSKRKHEKRWSHGVPRRLRMDRAGRLQAAAEVLHPFQGRNAIRRYAKWFGVDFECAIRELQLLGVTLDPVYIDALRTTARGRSCAARQRREDGRARDDRSTAGESSLVYDGYHNAWFAAEPEPHEPTDDSCPF